MKDCEISNSSGLERLKKALIISDIVYVLIILSMVVFSEIYLPAAVGLAFLSVISVSVLNAVSKKCHMHATVSRFWGKNNCFDNYVKDYYGEQFDIPSYGMHSSAFNKIEFRYRVLITVISFIVWTGIGVICILSFKKIPMFLIVVCLSLISSMYIDALCYDLSIQKEYAALYAKKNKCSDKAKSLRKAKAFLMYDWEAEDGDAGFSDKASKERSYVLGSLTREVFSSASQRMRQRHMFFFLVVLSLGVFFCILVPLHAFGSETEWAEFMMMSENEMNIFFRISFKVYGVIITSYVLKEQFWRFPEINPAEGEEQKLISDMKRNDALWKRFYQLRYAGFFLSQNDLNCLLTVYRNKGILYEIDHQRAHRNYLRANVEGLYVDSGRSFLEPRLTSEFPKGCRPRYIDQAYAIHKERGQLLVIFLGVIILNLLWILGITSISVWSILLAIAGIILALEIWNRWLYKLILPLPTVRFVKRKIKKLREEINTH